MSTQQSLLSRRSFLSLTTTAAMLFLIHPEKTFAINPAEDLDFSQADFLFKDGSISVYSLDNVLIFKDESGFFAQLKLMGNNSYSLYLSDGSYHTINTDDYGRTLFDGKELGELLYLHDPNDPVPNGCILMSKKKMTVQEAATPTQLLTKILGFFGNTQVKILTAIANTIFSMQVNSHKDMWLIMEHWYCDSPKMVTRKKWSLYSDSACTKLVKTWTTEAPVGVEV